MDRLLEGAPVAIRWLGPDGVIVRANEADLKLLGYSRGEFVGRHIAEFHADRDVIDDLLARLRRGETLHDMEARLRCKDGSLKHVLLNADMVRDSAGGFVHSQCFTTDVTKRTRREQVMRRLVECGRQTGAEFFRGMHRALAELLGARHVFSARLSTSKPGWAETLLVLSDGHFMPNFAFEVRRTPCERVLGGQPCLYSGEVANAFPGDELIARLGLESYAAILLRDRDGAGLGLLAVMGERPFSSAADPLFALELFALRAATELQREQSEEALRHSQQRLQTALDAGRMGAWDWNIAEERITWSPTLEVIHGLEPGTFRGRFEDFQRDIHPEDRQRVLDTIQRTLSDRDGYAIQYRIVRPDGRIAWLESSGTIALDSQGEPVGMSGVCADVTDRAKAAQRLAAEHAVASLLAGGGTLEELAPRVLRALCERLGFQVSALWQPRGEVLVCTEHHSSSPDLAEFVQASRAATFAPGIGLPGRVWATSAPAWINDVVHDANFPRARYAQRVGLHAGCAFPIRLGDEFLGVMEFFAPHIEEPDEALLAMMASVGANLAQFVFRTRIQADLERQRTQGEVIFNSVPAMIWFKDADHTIVRVNRAAAEITGLPAERIEGRTAREIYPAHADRADEEEREVMRTGRPKLGLIELLQLADGSARWLHADKLPYRDEHGRIRGVIVFAQDITRRRAAEKALRESEERFRNLADAAPVLIWLDGPQRQRTYLNQRWLEFTGRTLEQALPDGWMQHIHHDDGARRFTAYDSAFEARASYQVQYRLRRHDGQYRWVLETGIPRFESDGAFAGFIGSCMDITGAKSHELAVRRRSRQQRAMAMVGQRALSASNVEDLINEALIRTAYALRVPLVGVFKIPDAGPAVLSAGFGWPEGAIGRSTLILSPEQSEALGRRPLAQDQWVNHIRVEPAEMLKVCGSTGSSLSVMISGSKRPYGVLVACSTRPRTFRRADVHFIQTAADLLASAIARHDTLRELDLYRQHLETLVAQRTTALESSHQRLRLAERLASIGTLATGLGHDIGNLILPVLCRLDYLAAQEVPAAVRAELDSMREGVTQLRRLASGLRLFALDPTDASASATLTSAKSWWDETGALLRKTVPKGVQLSCLWPPDIPALAIAPHQFTQAIFNLVVNAGEAIAGEGQVRITFGRTTHPDGRRDGAGGMVRVTVSDTGKGMTDEVRRHAIDPFFTTKKRRLSTGLGLSLVHAVVDSAGGLVEIDSTPGAGTSVSLLLPEAATRPSGPDGLARSRVDLHDQRVAAYTCAMLASFGFQIVPAPQTPDAAREGTPAVARPTPNDVLWIVEPERSMLEPVREFLQGSPGRRVIVVGEPSDEWRQQGVIVADGTYRGMRSALQSAASTLLGASPC